MGTTSWIAAAAGLWFALSVAGVALVWRAWRRTMRLPELPPAAYLAAGKPRGAGPVVVCAGDSLTHGHASASFVELLRARFRTRGFTFVNAGINGELSYNLLQRIDEVIACEPDVVTVLIGTNDATASLMPAKTDKALGDKGVPVAPSPERYREWLTTLVARLTTRSRARVALISPPPIGEDLDAPIAVRSAEYAAIVEDVAAHFGVASLPLHERMVEVIRAEGAGLRPAPYDERNVLVLRSILAHHLLRRGWDEIGRRNGYVLLTDALHLGDRGATIVARLIEEFLDRGAGRTSAECAQNAHSVPNREPT